MASTSNGWSFGYDANGNMNAYKGSSISWYSYNLPNVINSAGQASQFFYRPNRNRWKQVATYPSGTETTIYVGGILEKVTAPSGTAYRHTIGAGSAKVLYTRWSTGTITTKYVTADHLGSSTLVMNDSGGTLVNLSFGSYGARRGSHWTGSPSSGDWSQIANSSRRGFTGHEHLDNVNFVHMNGRVYEPVLGRFISADPFMPASLGSQAPNRYAYVGNRPQSLVDPSGFQDRDVTEVLSGPRIFPQCRYQMPDISNDCPFQYGWRWDRDPFDLWLLQEETVEAWVRYMLATADTRFQVPRPRTNPPSRPTPSPQPTPAAPETEFVPSTEPQISQNTFSIVDPRILASIGHNDVPQTESNHDLPILPIVIPTVAAGSALNLYFYHRVGLLRGLHGFHPLATGTLYGGVTGGGFGLVLYVIANGLCDRSSPEICQLITNPPNGNVDIPN